MVHPLLLLFLLQTRDPFRPLNVPHEPPRVLAPLERFELEQLHLVAVVLGARQPYAMVEDPNGKGHVVRVGDRIGKNFGRVTAIRERTVVIREHSYDYLGRKLDAKHELIIPKLPIAFTDD